MVWQKLGHKDYGSSSGDAFSTDTYTAKETSQWFSHGEANGTNNSPRSFFNGNETDNDYYSTRTNWHATATGADTTQADQDNISDSSGNDDDFFKMGYLCDVSGEQKLFIAFAHGDHSNNYGNVYASVGKIEAGIGTTITKYGQWDSYWENDFQTWTNVTVVGGDDTIPSSPLDDFGTHLAGTIFTETDTAKYKWYDGTSWLRDGSEHGANRGLFMGGYTSDETNTIDYITIATLGNASDFGDLTQARMMLGCCTNGTRACFGGGEGSYFNIIDYVTVLTTANAVDFGNLTVARKGMGGFTASTTRGLFSGGENSTTTIDYITIASAGDATDFGDHMAAYGTSITSSLTRALIHIGQKVGDSYHETVEYVTIDTTGNTTDFGDLTDGRNGTMPVTNLTRAVFGGGKYASGGSVRNIMDYVTIATTANATDFGDLTQSRHMGGASSSTTRGCFAGGYDGSSSNYNIIDYITIDTTGNASDFGDLTTATRGIGGVSDLY